jgi:pimeloyl-ACP methyl ester carboxylesterase
MTAPSAPLTHRLTGEGPPVVLLNGGMMTFPAWEPFIEKLGTGYQVLRFDFRGQLLSPGEGPADLAGHAADVLALLDQVGWTSAHWIGASFGAVVAVEAAARAPERARSLSVVTAMDRETPEFGRGGEEMHRILAEILAGGDPGRFYDHLIDGIYSPGYRAAEAATLAARRRQVAQLPLAWYAGVDRLLAAMAGFDLTPRLAAVRCPALAVLAADDQVMSAERARALAAAIGAEVAVHPTAGHGLVAEDPAWLAGVCRDFLDRRERAAR